MNYDPENLRDGVDPKIKIHHVDGGSGRDKADLESCYFEQVGNPGVYRLFENGDDHSIPTAPSLLRSGTDFQFIRGGVMWTVTEFFIDPLKAHGHWQNTRPRPTGDDDGSFQAQAGPTVEGEKSAASARG
jgi:hypothetical protein